MFSFIKNAKSLKDAYKKTLAAYQEDKNQEGWQALSPLLAHQQNHADTANKLIDLIREEVMPYEHGCDILELILQHHPSDHKLLCRIGNNLDCIRDIDQLNLAAPEHPVFQRTVDAINQALETCTTKQQEDLLEALACAARMMARQHDKLIAECHQKLLKIAPDTDYHHYNYGLYCKTRGLFKEGVKANQRALELTKEAPQSYLWNLGICATGAGEADIALDIWKKIGCKIEMGRFGLPEGGFPGCKVRLAEFPLAERNKDNDDPGQEESIWIERLSPCHGIIKSVLYYDIGVDYGDVILTDGAPITYHKYGDDDIAVFPHLATLLKRNYQFYNFTATQQEKRQIYEISNRLKQDAVIYPHSENLRFLCANCYKDPNCNHHEDKPEQKNTVTGRIAAPPDYDPAQLLAHIDAQLEKLEGCELYSPDLCIAAGKEERAEAEQRKFEMLRGDG